MKQYLTNYHTHTTFCDGKDTLQAFAESAAAKGFAALGFSTHAAAPGQESWTMQPGRYPEYFAAVTRITEEYAGRLEIYSGMEIDYIPGIQGPSSPDFPDLGLDYTIGGVHIIEVEAQDQPSYCTIDGSEEEFEVILRGRFGGDRKALVRHFFSLNRRMIEEHTFDIIAHFDLVKVRNRGNAYYSEDEQWYRDSVMEALEAAARAGVVLEINTGGLSRGKTDSFYPSVWILKEARRLGIPITINADAHTAAGIDAMFPEAADAARAAGYREKRVLLGGRWQDAPL